MPSPFTFQLFSKEKRMKAKSIAIFSAYYPPHMGGVERFTYNIASELSSRGNNVSVITSGTNGFTHDEHEAGVKVVRIPSISIMNDRFPLIAISPTSKKAIHHLFSLKFDLVIINTRYYPICFLGCAVASSNKIQPVVIDHSSGYLANGKTIPDRIVRLYEKLATSKIKKFDPVFFSVSHRGERWLSELGITSHGVIPNSIDADKYIASASQRNWRDELHVQNNHLVVFAGRLIEEKGVMDVLAAFERLMDAGRAENIHLAIAGKGPLEETIASFSDNYSNVHFLGPLPPSDLSSLLKVADIFCYPSKYPEGLPTVLLEAAAQKTGIITSDCAGAKEVVPGPTYGIVLNNTEPRAIAQAITKLSTDVFYLNTCKERVGAHVAENFSWSSTAAKIESLPD